MADPLSIAGSIAGLVSIGDTVFRRVYHFTRTARNAQSEILDLKSEIAVLTGVLHNLRLVADDLEGEDINNSLRVEHVNSCLATLYKLDEPLKKMDFSQGSQLQHSLLKLKWPFKASQTKEICEEIRRHRELLGLALSADSMTALLKCLSLQEGVSKRVDDIQKALFRKEDIETRISMDAKRNRILQFFLTVDPDVSLRKNVKLRHPTTGFWLTNHKDFRSIRPCVSFNTHCTGQHMLLLG
jgi:hypothetical protein